MILLHTWLREIERSLDRLITSELQEDAQRELGAAPVHNVSGVSDGLEVQATTVSKSK